MLDILGLDQIIWKLEASRTRPRLKMEAVSHQDDNYIRKIKVTFTKDSELAKSSGLPH